MTTPSLGLTELPNSVFDPTEIVNGLLSGIEAPINDAFASNVAIDEYFDLLGAIVDYKLDESSGNAVDRVGAQDLTASGALTYQQDSGLTGAGYGVNFDGSTGYFVASNASVFDSASSGSVAVCFNADALPASGTVNLTGYTDNASTNWFFTLRLKSDGKIQASLRTTSSSSQWIYESPVAVTNSSVYTVTLSHDGVNPSMFINGSSVTLTATATSLDISSWLDVLTSSENLSIGAMDRTTTTDYFDGDIYRVVYMTSVINATKAIGIHNALNSGYSGIGS